MLRLISAFIGIPIIITVLYVGTSTHFLIFISVLAVLASLEFFKMVCRGTLTATANIGVILAALVPLYVFWTGDKKVISVLSILTILFLTISVFRGPKFDKKEVNIQSILFGVLYVGVLISNFILIRELPDGNGAVLLILIVIWTSDTSAYYIGKNFGKTRLIPSVSPNKTVEGVIAGLTGASIGALVSGPIIYDTLPPTTLIIFGIILGILGILGDLGESLIKRENEVKDSGSIIPGHGGVLDRIDSLLFAGPIFYLLISIT